MRGAPAFGRYVGIDYSGAQTAETSLPGLRLYLADRMSPPCEVQPPVSPRKYWTRRGLAHWLAELLAEDTPTLVGIDHAFGFPFGTLNNMLFRSTGQRSLMTSSVTGLRMQSIFTWRASATVHL
jgi:hypothetical protein